MSINRFSGINGDPNYYSQLVLVSVALLISCIIYESSKKCKGSKFNKIILTMILTICGFRSRSKSYAITILVIFIMLIIYVYKNKFKYDRGFNKIKALYFVVLLIVSILGAYIIISNIIIPVITSRNEGVDFLTGRGYIWKDYISTILNNPFIILNGVGPSNGWAVVAKFIGHGDAAHNVYLEIIVEIGVLSTILCLFVLRRLFNNTKLIYNNVFSIFVIIFMFTSLGLSLSSNDAIFILLPLIFISYNIESKQQEMEIL